MLGWRGTSDAVHMSVMEDQHQRGAQLVRITLALTPSLIHRLDERRKHEPDLPDRGALIRRLLEKALSVEEEERGRERAGGCWARLAAQPGVGGSASSKRG